MVRTMNTTSSTSRNGAQQMPTSTSATLRMAPMTDTRASAKRWSAVRGLSERMYSPTLSMPLVTILPMFSIVMGWPLMLSLSAAVVAFGMISQQMR